MQDSEKASFAAIMNGLAENYGQTVTAQGVSMRFEALRQYDISAVRRAAMSLLVSRKYTTVPTVADFVEHLAGGSAEDKAEVEAGKVLAAIERHGGYATVVFDDPTTQAVIVQAYGGWPKLCADCGVEESEKWFRVGFVKTWAAYKRQGVTVYGALAGRHEIANGAAGRVAHIPKPVFIGDKARAHHVLTAVPKDAPRLLPQEPASFATVAQRSMPNDEAMRHTQ